MNFKAFDKSKIDEYAKRAREEWGNTDAYKEYAEKTKDRTPEEDERLAEGFMEFFAELGTMKHESPDSEKSLETWVPCILLLINSSPQALVYKDRDTLPSSY